jgi:hypothetical protein
MKSSYQIEQEVRAARAEGRPVYYVAAEGWRWGVYIEPVFACREDADAEAERSSARGGARCFRVEVGT